MLSLVVGLFAGVRPTRAAEFTGVRDTLSRLQASVTANHTFNFTLPSGVDFDAAGAGADTLTFMLDNFVTGGTYTTADFSFNDGTSRVIDAVATGNDVVTVSCADGANNVGVAIDDTAPRKFTVVTCGASFTASPTGANVTFTINGDSPNGTLTNPSAGNQFTQIQMKDENVAVAHSKSFQVAIVDSDTVNTSATVDPTMTFDIDTATGDTESGQPYSVNLGSITTGAVATSGGSINSIWMDIATNATNGATITVINTDTNTDLVSNSVPGDAISSAGTNVNLVAGTEGYGICVVSATATSGLAIGNVDANFDGDGSNDGCTASTSDNFVTTPPNSGGAAATLVSNATAPIVAGRVRVAVKAAISATTEAHNDYTDSLRFIATANF
jgi:hypothetical protein